MTRVLVTGAAGFIGSHLSQTLLDRGHAVRGLDAFTDFYDPRRKRANLASLEAHPRFELVEADLLALEAPQLVDGVLEGVDAVAHLAGEPGVTSSWGRSFERYLQRNVLATQRLLDALTVRPVARLVYASSSSVHGPGAEAAATARRGVPRPASPYGVSKLAAETLVGAYARAHGLSAVSLRYFSVYGPRQRPDMAAHRFIDALLHDRPLPVFGDGRQARDFTYVDDVVRATAAALTADLPPGAVLDVASGRPVTVGALIDVLRDLVGHPAPELEHRPERAGDVPRTQGRIDATVRLLGWAPETDLRVGLDRQVRWHCDRSRDRSPFRIPDPSLLSAAG